MSRYGDEVAAIARPLHGPEDLDVLGDRYDAFLWFDETHAVNPLHPLHIDVREPETYPTGV